MHCIQIKAQKEKDCTVAYLDSKVGANLNHWMYTLFVRTIKRTKWLGCVMKTASYTITINTHASCTNLAEMHVYTSNSQSYTHFPPNIYQINALKTRVHAHPCVQTSTHACRHTRTCMHISQIYFSCRQSCNSFTSFVKSRAYSVRGIYLKAVVGVSNLNECNWAISFRYRIYHSIFHTRSRTSFSCSL